MVMDSAGDAARPANHTVRRLLALKPGANFQFYLGNLPGDINRCSGAPQYAEVLAAVWAAARRLEAAGRIAISEREVEITNKDGQAFTVIAYTATGLAGGSAG
jgi:hypothetical protein